MEAATPPGIGLASSREDAIAIAVEGDQKSGFGARCRPVDPR